MRWQHRQSSARCAQGIVRDLCTLSAKRSEFSGSWSIQEIINVLPDQGVLFVDDQKALNLYTALYTIELAFYHLAVIILDFSLSRSMAKYEFWKYFKVEAKAWGAWAWGIVWYSLGTFGIVCWSSMICNWTYIPHYFSDCINIQNSDHVWSYHMQVHTLTLKQQYAHCKCTWAVYGQSMVRPWYFWHN